MRKPLVFAIALAAVISVAAPVLAATGSVKVDDNYYVRDRSVPVVTVKRNDIVRWRFVGRSAHTVTVQSGPQKFSSPARTSGVFARRMTVPGTYRIYCKIHGPADQSMVLNVR